MATVLFSKEGKYRVFIREVPSMVDDGNYYHIDVTGRIMTSESRAVRNARRWLKKKREAYYKKHPEKRVRIKVRRLVPKKRETPFLLKQFKKLYVMDLKAAKILVRMSEKKLKIHLDYSRKKFENEKTTAVSGETCDFNLAISTVLIDGTKKERKAISKMLREFTHEPFRKTNMFY